MNNKILVEVYLPAAGRAYDVFIPLKIKLHEALILLGAAITELSQGSFIASEETVICDRSAGTIFNINMTVEELGLYNGSKLMLL